MSAPTPRPAPAWYAERFGRVAAAFDALAAARTPDPRPLAPVRSLDGARLERAAKAIKALMERSA